MPASNEEVLAAFKGGVSRSNVPEVTLFRSTWLTSSLRAIRERGLMDQYLAFLPEQHHAPVLEAVAGVWLPAEVSLAHYQACDKLPLSSSQLLEIGTEVGRHVQGSVLSVAVSLAKGAGVTPWTILVRMPDVWQRTWVGGGVAVYKLGPKEARLEIAGWPSARTHYCRIAMRGVVGGLVELFCQKAYVKDVPTLCTAMTLGYRISWA